MIVEFFNRVPKIVLALFTSFLIENPFFLYNYIVIQFQFSNFVNKVREKFYHY